LLKGEIARFFIIQRVRRMKEALVIQEISRLMKRGREEFLRVVQPEFQHLDKLSQRMHEDSFSYGYALGFGQGKATTSNAIVTTMLEHNYSMDEIIKMTGLSKEYIDSLSPHKESMKRENES
jgi:hypothetical protein